MGTAAAELAKLNKLIKDQTALIEKLYAANVAATHSIKVLTDNNKQLGVANNKQKDRIIQLNRKIKLQNPTPKTLFRRMDDSLATLATSLNPI